MRHRRHGELLRPSCLLLVLLVIQVTLGALTVLTGRQYLINSLHVVTGASVLVTSLVLTLRAHRTRLDAVSAAARSTAYGIHGTGAVDRSRPAGVRA
jgi:heme A synthase